MGRITQTPGSRVRVKTGTTVHVWDLEAGKSDTWMISGKTAGHSFLVKSAEPAPNGGAHLTLVQPGFEREYEIRVHSSLVDELAPARRQRFRARPRRATASESGAHVSLAAAASLVQSQAEHGATLVQEGSSAVRALVNARWWPISRTLGSGASTSSANPT